GQTLAVACQDRTLQLWDAATGRPLGPPLRHHHALLGVAFTPDGRTVRATTADGLTRSWPVPAPLPDDPEVVTQWLEAATGNRAEGNAVLMLDPETWQARRRDLAATWPEEAAALACPA